MSLDRKLSQLLQLVNPPGAAQAYLVDGGLPYRAPLSEFPVSTATEDRIVEAVAEGLSSVGTNKIYADFAEANADLGNIADLEFVTVIADENFEGRRTAYRKEGGVLVNRYVEDEQDTSDFPHLSQDKSQPYWITKLLADTDSLVGPTPSLDLDFEKGVFKVEGESDTFANTVTYTRADAVATKYHASGKLATVGTDTPQFEYNPETGERYLLLEPARTNLLTRSEEFDNAAWTKVNATVNANAAIAPDGTTTAAKLVEGAVDGVHVAFQLGGSPLDGEYTTGVYAKAAERSFMMLSLVGSQSISAIFDLSLGVVTHISTGVVSAEIKKAGNGFWHCSLVDVVTSGPVYCYIGTRQGPTSTATYTGDGTSGIYIWGAQLEQGSYPTSYIKTVASAVTRAAPLLLNLAGEWANADEGTFFVEYKNRNLLGDESSAILHLSDGTENNRISMFADEAANNVNNGTIVSISNGGVFNPSVVNGDVDSSLNKNLAAFSYSGSGVDFARNGALVSGALPSGLPPVSSTYQLTVGSAGTGAISSMEIYALRYYPKALTQAQLVALTGA